MNNNVLVLMSTYNGEKYINEQIESLLHQEGVQISLLIRDDGSTDNTVKLLNEWKDRVAVEVYTGENLKPARSFMDLVSKAGTYDYYAFCDQDDYWKPDKLSRAISFLEKASEKPALYLSATTIVDEKLRYIGEKKIGAYKNFENAMIKNEAVGCTEVFNYALMRKLQSHIPNFIMMHDSWVCRVCFAIGGEVFYDNESRIDYRQHGNNVLGYKEPRIKKMLGQLNISFRKKIRIREEIAKELYDGYAKDMGNNELKIVEALMNYNRNIKSKIFLLFNPHFKTPYRAINAQMRLAILLNKF